ncbi:hypothetical protein BGX28_010084 [Mortierella sp. GBA30]|nr:hypothetical protein BGX28_010084 [Mortierella sp. GBA30]
MSSSSSSPPDTIASFLQSDDFKAYMRSTLREVLGPQSTLDRDYLKRDEQIAPPIVTELFTPSASERERCPGIWPTDPHDFFRRKVSNDDWSNGLRQYPKNTRVIYDSPVLPAVVQCTNTFKAHDNQLARIQCDIAHLTRPIDHLIHGVLSASDIPDESEELLVSFANLMRDQLEQLASKINTVRTENLRKDRGFSASDTSNQLIDPHTFNEEIKTAKALAAAFAPPKASHSNNNNNNGGRDKSGKQGQQQQRRKRHDKGSNSDKQDYVDRRNSASESDEDSDRGRERSSFHKAKGKDRRDSRSRHRGKSGSRKPSNRE